MWDPNRISVDLMTYQSSGVHMERLRGLAAEAGKRIGRQHELYVYSHALGSKCRPDQFLVGERHSGGPIYFQCSADTHYPAGETTWITRLAIMSFTLAP